MAKKLKEAIPSMEAMMSPQAIQRSRQRAEQEIMAIKLGQLRERFGLKQSEIEHFSKDRTLETGEEILLRV